MAQLSEWVGAGLVTAGVSAALIAGAGVASADSDSGSDSGGGSGSTSSSGPSTGSTGSAGAKSDPGSDAKTSPASSATAEKSASVKHKEAKDEDADTAAEAEPTSGTTPPDAGAPHSADARVVDRTQRPAKRAPKATVAEDEKSATASETPAARRNETSPTKEAPETTAREVVETAAVETGPKQSVAQGLIGAVVNVASLAFNAVQAVEALVTGPPLIPPGSTVTVRSSTVELSNGQTVPANWYYPEGDDVPEHVILLQHGFLALGPMYSYTAASLADQTKSIVVTTTLSSNPLAGDSFWLGGTGMAASIADLFEGDRAALTTSAVAAGFAARYGPDAELPRRFALAGHSLGANLVSAAAGSLAEDCSAESCAADDLAGVILFDGVPLGDTLPNALTALNAKEPLTGYIPVREIGAPPNLFNFPSTVNRDLAQYRPGRYDGVVLDRGVHMDSMRGGNALIQFAAYLIAGFPQAQNPPAVEALADGWLDDWFAGDTDNGDDLVPGSSIEIPTAAGTAHGIVLGNPPVALASSPPSAIPALNPWLADVAA